MENQINLSFEPNAHKYSDDEGQVYTPVTTLIDKYKEPFNKRYWSMYTTLRDAGYGVRPTNGLQSIVVDNQYRSLDSLYSNPINCHEVNLLVDKWKKITKIACDRGNDIHDYLEDSVNISKGDDGSTNKEITPQLNKALNNEGLIVIATVHDLDKTNLIITFPKIYYRLLKYINMGCILYAEKRIYSTTYLIAGTIDVLIIKGKQFAILDWKTNKDIMLFKSGYFKKAKVNNTWVKTTKWIDKKKYLFAPLSNIEDCKGMLYTLQLSLYAYIMELWGYRLVADGLEIFHMRPNLKPKLIKVRYLKSDIHRMLEHFKAKREKKGQTNLFGVR